MNLRVLVADDDALMRKFLAVSLSAIGVTEVTEAASGDEALALFEQRAFDLLILDWDMPGKNGLEVIQTVRAAGSQIPIIMATAEADKQQVVRAIQAGATDYLVKPFESDALWEKLKKYY